MGLDMYLYKCNKMGDQPISSYSLVENKLEDINIKEFDNDPCKVNLVDLTGIPEASSLKLIYEKEFISYLTIFKEVGYWRKCNEVHLWFVNNVQNGEDDCGLYIVTKENLLELISLCGKILEDKSLSPSLLPTCSGFFFGNTEYDQYYFDDIKDTIGILQKVVADTNFDKEVLFYRSSW